MLKKILPLLFSISLVSETILVDGANGANYKITPMLLEELGAKVIRVNCNPDGFNINEKSAVLDKSLFKIILFSAK